MRSHEAPPSPVSTTWMCDALVSPHKIRWRLSFGCPTELRLSLLVPANVYIYIYYWYSPHDLIFSSASTGTEVAR